MDSFSRPSACGGVCVVQCVVVGGGIRPARALRHINVELSARIVDSSEPRKPFI